MVIAGQTVVTLRVVLPVQPFTSVALIVKVTADAAAVGVPWSWPLLVIVSQAGAPLSV